MTFTQAKAALNAAFPEATNMSIQPDCRFRNGEWSLSFDVYVHRQDGSILSSSNLPTVGLAAEAVIAKAGRGEADADITAELDEAALALA